MITIQEAFDKFKSRLELTEREQADASRRNQEIREFLREKFEIDRDSSPAPTPDGRRPSP
jgi:hypothetical protein